MRSLAKVLITLSILLSFAAHSAHAQIGFTTKTYPVGNNLPLQVADLNHDGRPDLVGGAGDIYLNDGNGGFKLGFQLNPTGEGELVTFKIADLNQDGTPDIVGCLYQQSQTSDFYSLLTWLNDGTGRFAQGQSLSLPGACTSLVLADVNHDGHPDVIVSTVDLNAAGTRFSNDFATYFNNGAARLSAPVRQLNVNLDLPSASNQNATTGCRVGNMTSGDFYQNGEVSLIVNTSCWPSGGDVSEHAGTAFLARGDGAGHFIFGAGRAFPESLNDGQTVDLNADGRPDALFRGMFGTLTSNIYSAINSGGGSLAFKLLTSAVNTGGARARFNGITAGDLTRDGVNDVATIYSLVNENSSIPGPPVISILAGSPSGAFVESQHWTVDPQATSFGNIVAADFNGDGRIDLATIAQRSSGAEAGNTLYVYTSQAPASTACRTPSSLNTNIICSPATGAGAASPFTVTAASNVTALTLNRLYLDNRSVYQTTSPVLNTPLQAGSGTHTLVLVSYNRSGQAFTTRSTFRIGAGTPACLPTGPGATICAPGPAQTSASPVTITAGAFAQQGNIAAMRGYIDNVAVFTINNPVRGVTQQVTQTVKVAAGNHTLVVLGYQSTGGQVSATQKFTVKAAPSLTSANAPLAAGPPTPSLSIFNPARN
jgi:hypothetical protein